MVKVGIRGFGWTSAWVAVKGVLGLTGPTHPSWTSRAVMNKPGDLKLIHQSRWVYDNQSPAARNSFGKNTHSQLLSSSHAP
jgi:hypothetical protein